MGVDIQTYRVRIGTNKFANGTDVVLLQRCVNFSAGLKAVGAVTFIVMLLLMAGIEPNPGPPKKGMQTISDEDSSGDEEERQLKAERAQKKEMRRIQRQQKQLQQEQQTDKTENISSNIVRATTRQHTAPNGPINQQSPCTIGDANNTQKESGEPGFETTSDEDSSDDEEARQLKAERAQKKEMKRLKGQLENIQKDQHSYTKEDISSKIVHVTTTQHKEPNVPVKHQSAFTKSDVFPAKKVSGVTGLQTLSDEDSLDDKETRQLNAEMAQKMEMIRLKRKQEKMHNDRSNIVQGMQTVSDEDSSKDKEARQLKTELAQNIEMRPLKRQQEKMQKKPHTDKAEDISSNVVQELVQKMEKTRISSQQEKKEKKPHTVKTEEFSSNIVEGVQTVSDEDSSEDKEARQLKTELAQNIEMRRPKRQQEKMQKEPHTDKAEDISSNVVQVTTTQHKKPNFPAKHQSTLTKSDAFPTKKESGVQGVQMISDENSSDDEETKRFKAEQEKMDKEPHTDKPEDIYSTSNIVQDLQTISDEGYADVDEARQLKSELSQKKEMRRKEPHTDITEEISSNIVQGPENNSPSVTETRQQRVTTTQSTLTKSDAFPTEKESGVQGVQMLSDENSSDDKETKHFKAEQDKMEKEPHGDKTEDISSTSNIVQERREDIPKLLRRLGLEEHSRHKPITVKEAVVVNTKELNTEEMPLSQKPWVMLRGIISVNSNARDNNSTMHTSNSRESPEPPAHTKGNIRSRFGKAKTKPVSKPDVVSQMDIFMATYLCCEPKLRQILFRNMFLCKQAIPFIYNELHSAKYSVAVWPLKPLVFYTGTAMFKEEHVLDMKTRVVSFARIGRPKVSKSQMLNCIISNESNAYATFYAHDCPGGMIPREIVGFVEMFWLQQSTNTALPNNIPLTLLNIRGDIRNDISRTCVDFIESISDCIILFLDTTQRKEVLTFFKRKLPACRLILYFTDCLSENNNEETFADIEEILNVLHLPDESIQEHSLDKNFFHNTTDLVKHIFKYVRTSEDICVLNRIKSVCNAHIKLDTDNEQCKQGTELALEVLKVMKTELICKIEQEKTLSSDICLFKYCKQYLTPVSYCVTKKLSQVLKERKRAHALENKSSLDEKVLQLRSEQLQITDTVKTFILCLSKANRSPIIRQYFLANLRALLYNESKSFLPSMKIEKSKVRSDYIDLKAKDPDKKENIERLQNCLAMLDLDIENATFGVEHLFREVGHICDSSQHNQTCLTDLPSTEDIASTVADLVLDGETLEIIDGDNVFLASKWIAMVFNEIDKKTKTGRVMTLSVLGLQSSGKSTMLNSMFGIHFTVSSGRCTRGINAQLLPVNQNHTTKVQHVLIIDSEGLRAPELDSATNVGNRDNELATFITGLGDLTLMNIMGENFSDMRDILQIVVHAFLRLKLATGALQGGQTCMFVHQNVTDKSARDNMKDGFLKLIQILDAVTAEAAETEGQNDLKRFTDIIKFNENEQVYHIPNLWQGNPPMNRVNKDYSKSVSTMKYGVLESALKLKQSIQPLSDLAVRAENLWSGILSENFVFSFRNNLEIKAYRALDKHVRTKEWEVEIIVRGDTLKTIRERFMLASTKRELLQTRDDSTDLCNEKISKLTFELKETLEDHFKSSNDKEIIQKWKVDKIMWAQKQCDSCRDDIKTDIQKYYENKLVQIELSSNTEQRREELRKKSTEIASSLRDKRMTNADIQKAFDEMWRPFEKDIRSQISSTCMGSSALMRIFREELRELHKNDINPNSINELMKHDSSETVLNNLQDSFPLIKLKAQDFSWKKGYKKWLANFTEFDLLDAAEKQTKVVLETMQTMLDEFLRVSSEITNSDVTQFVRILEETVMSMIENSNKITFRCSYRMKVNVHVCCYAATVFGKHNNAYEETHGANVLLGNFKNEMSLIFEADIANRRKEETAAHLFCLGVQQSVKTVINDNAPLQAEMMLRSHLPQVKYILLKEICKDLAENGKIADFIQYITYPKNYAMGWLTKRSNARLFDDGGFMQIVSEEASTALDQIKSALIAQKSSSNSGDTIDGRTWLSAFNSKMKGFTLDSSNFSAFKTQVIEDVNFFSETLRQELETIEVVSIFSGVNANNVEWSGNDPYTTIFKKVWGCEAHCPFCREPCSQNDHNPWLVKHVCNQHRPQACIGTRWTGTSKATLEVCNFAVDSDQTHKCGVFDFKCNNNKKEDCVKTYHPYKNYTEFYPEWDIRPNDSMHNCAKFWLWFLGQFKDDLRNHHKYDVSNFLSSWSKINKIDAIKSLDECYN